MKINNNKLSKGILIIGIACSMICCSYGFEDTLYKIFETTGHTQTDIPRDIKFEIGGKKIDIPVIIMLSQYMKIFEEIAKNNVVYFARMEFYQWKKKL